ncbi:MAG TPA: hypothetical protein VNN07_00350 [Candidatus Tectomicrobia bacterium]|nr:hypothetical protein [Candidatus Tectomicrobia bacterium]
MRASIIVGAFTAVLALAPLTAAAQQRPGPGNIPTDVLGRLQHIEPQSRTLYFQDGRIVTLEPGATIWVDGREVSIETLRPGMTVVVRDGQPATTASAQAQARRSTQAAQALPSHPPVTASGTVAKVDEDARTVTFQDGRTLKLGPRSRVWESSELGDIQPGERAMVEAAQPVGYAMGANIPAGRMRMGRVIDVDPARRMVLLDDGTWVYMTPATKMRLNGREMVTTLQPGDELVVVVSETPATQEQAPAAMPGAVARPRTSTAPQGDAALQGSAVRADEIHIIRRPQAP